MAPAHDNARAVSTGARATGGLAGWQARRLRALAETQLPDLTVNAMAAAVDLHPDYFTRAFRQTFGVPPRAWLLERRLTEAQRRLRETPDTVEQIALALGYRSGSQLSRAFRARFGVAPQAFRRA